MADSWHLDKKVPLALIITVVSAIATGVWWTSAANGRIVALERSDALTMVRMDEAANTRNVMRERLARIEQQGSDNQDMLRRILDRLK